MTILSGKAALVAGGTAGIGLAVAEALAGAGATVTIGGRRANGADIASAAGCGFVTLDVADEQSVIAALEQSGPLDVLVLNAGVAQPPGPIATLDSDAARAVVETNLLGVFWGLKHAPAHFRDRGSIIVTSSISAVMGAPFEALYGATKAGASALVRSAAIDLGAREIRVNAIQPGPMWTEMNPMPEALFEVMAPLARKGTVEDLVGAYLFLASDESRYITGQALSVDGGITAGLTGPMLGLAARHAARAAEQARATAEVVA